MGYLLKFLPFVTAFADEAAQPTFMDGVIKWAASIGGAIIAIFLIISLVKDGMEFAKGQGSVSIWKILGKAVFLILIIGLIFLAQNYQTLGNTAQGIGNSAFDVIGNEVNTILP